MKHYPILLFILVLSACNSDFASMSPIRPPQPYKMQLGTFGDDTCQDLVVDEKSKSVYCVGRTLNLAGTGDGSNDVLIVKFDRDGRVLWQKQYGSPNAGDETCTAVGIDANGDIYCGGTTNGMFSSSPQRYDSVLPRDVSDTDIDAIVLKINPDGDVLWIKQFGTPARDGCGNLAVAPNGNAYCGGETMGNLGDDPYGNPDVHDVVLDATGTSDTNSDSIIVKLNSQGDIIWKRQIGTFYYPEASLYSDKCAGVAIDRDENVFCVGTTVTSLFETNSMGITGNNADIYIWGLDKNGERHLEIQVGQETMTNESEVTDSTGADYAYDVTVDDSGNIYVVGFTYGKLGTLSLGGGADAVVLKFSRAGDLIWSQQGGYAGEQVLNSVAVDKSGKVYVIGTTNSSIYGPHDGTTDIFIACLRTDEALLWGQQYSTNMGFLPGGTENALAFALDSAGNIYVGGNTNGNFVGKNADSGTNDLFVLRLRNDGSL